MNFESHQDAVRWRKVHCRKLRAGGKRQRRVARMLGKCRKAARCKTEACRVCMRNFRLWWLGEAIKIVVQRPTWTRCSIIPAATLIPYGQLKTFNLTAELKRIRKRLQRLKDLRGRIIFGAFDVSLNLHNNVIAGWQIHIYLLVEGHNEEALQKEIKNTFHPEPTALRPYDFTEVKEPVEAITYTYKALIERRYSWTDAQGKFYSKDGPLKGNDLRELLPFLAKNKVGARLILSGLRRNGQRLVFTRRSPRPCRQPAKRRARYRNMRGDLDQRAI